MSHSQPEWLRTFQYINAIVEPLPDVSAAGALKMPQRQREGANDLIIGLPHLRCKFFLTARKDCVC